MGRFICGHCSSDECNISMSFISWLMIFIILAALFALAMTWILTRSKCVLAFFIIILTQYFTNAAS
jgi:hypothetical protein